ncbi:class I SAM-dependent methyltransferase [uncultured Friedmanniella sp.]|uniref:class I SAM-dependent methyltransferase n=1 Tax=uncultured Friedmanniella sp. TaxID=335381 RepID=UPI0035C95496
MTDPPRTPYPAAATAWMVGEERARVLDLGSGRGSFATMLADAGHEVFTLDRDADRVAVLAGRLDSGLHVAGQVEAMPFLSCHFDVVTASQTLHHFAPGLALTEIARVLRPGGHLAIAYNTRDDTVPWVRRLTAMMRAADPTAMSGDFGQEAVDTVADSPYFVGLERRTFRNWVPITRGGLLSMVRRQPWAAGLDDDTREQLLGEVGQLYDTSARPPEPLLLPFQAACWRAEVDHTDLVLDEVADALEIRI